MRTHAVMALSIAVFLYMGAPDGGGAQAENNWPSWRGPTGDGAVAQGDPPITWSESENIKWKVALPGDSDSTPIVWGNKIFVQTAVATREEPKKDKKGKKSKRGKKDKTRQPGSLGGTIPTVPYAFKILCLDRETGETLWERTAHEALPHESHHPHTSFSAYSPVTDGEKLWVSFGSRGLYCYDLEGTLVWSAGLVTMNMANEFGEGSSPALVDDTVIVVADHEGDSKILAFDKDTGALKWERDRDEASTWATPFPVQVNGVHQVITSGLQFIRSYDLQTGDLVWQCAGLSSGAIPSPVAGFGNVYCSTGYDGYVLLAIRLDAAAGDVTDSGAIAWSVDRGTPYVSSPLLYQGKIYVLESIKPVLSCYRAQTGEPVFEQLRLEGLKSVYASPVGVAGRIYIADRKGNTAVLKHSDTLEVLAVNSLDEGCDASPVVIGDELYLKGENHLYCIAKR